MLSIAKHTVINGGPNPEKEDGEATPEQVGDDLSAGLAGWTFSGGVYRTFDEHIGRSVPMYAECHDLILGLSDFFVRQDSLIYELGSATGTLASQLANRHGSKIRRIIGIDIEQSMVAESERKYGGQPGLEFVEADLLAYRFDPCDFVISYYTLQFLRLEERHDVIKSVYDRMVRGGAFVLFEKVREPNGHLQDLMGQLYADYKLRNGFTPGEIMAKTRSIRSALEPSTSEDNIDALRQAGFRSVGLVHKSLCFEGYLAVK
ncbi:methyltransferase domain-containing protein [Streptomyces inhibens]|uniref:methyltransferase domain-containing protein n=1 Tax=Streptomyces inhibens TaxID=2293571 RepID=UPI001EE6DBB3|nr:methyltransferase domain-containing protein [Streptomyces inhibens]UKY54135.1 methyltransferase domain-containing protein [Streptomyces inhibens]